MKKGLSFWMLSIWFAIAASALGVAGAGEFSWGKATALNQALFEKYGASVVDVAYYVRPDEYGKVPDYGVPYLCPNCHSMHIHNLESNISQQKPVLLPGFVVADNKVITQNAGLRPEWVNRIEVRFQGNAVPAAVSAFFPDENAVELTLAEPAEGLRPIDFAAEPGEPRNAFYVVNEDSVRVCGVNAIATQDVKYNVTLDFQYLSCSANTLLVDEKQQPVALSFKAVRKTGMDFVVPTAWRRLSVEEYWGQDEALHRKLQDCAYPVTITLEEEKKPKDYRTRYFSDDDENSTTFETYGLLLKSGELLVFQQFTPMQTARLSKIVVTLPDGKETSAAFVGSVRRFGLMVVKTEEPLSGTPVEFATHEECVALLHEPIVVSSFANAGGEVSIQNNFSTAKEMESSFSGVPVLSPANVLRDSYFIFSPDGKLCVLSAKVRAAKDDYEGRSSAEVPALLVQEILSSESPYDTFNVPQSKEDQNRMIVAFGVQGQPLTKQMVSERKLKRFFRDSSYYSYSSEGMLVTAVQPDSLAESIGIRPDDVLLYFRASDDYVLRGISGREESDMMFDDEDGFPWDQYDELPEQYFEMIPMPWGSVRTKLNLTLASFGIGNQVVVGLAREGKLVELEFTLVAKGETFESAPRYRQRSMGFTVADLSPEVRSYFQIPVGEPGVVVAQVRSGSAASGAGLKPYEVIVAVDGEPVHDVKEFQELTNKKQECSFTVRRLVNSHVVKIKGKVGPVAQ